MNNLEKLTEATILALQGKLNENKKVYEGVYVKDYIETFDDLYKSSWGSSVLKVLDDVRDAGLEEELMDWLEGFGPDENSPIDRVELNDIFMHHYNDVYEALGMDKDLLENKASNILTEK